MAALIKLTLFMIAVIAMANSQRVVDAPANMPPNLPWVPQFVSCEFEYETGKSGPTCNDCYSTIHCTPKFGVMRNCFGTTPHCVDGKCVSEPSAECSEIETVTDVYSDN